MKKVLTFIAILFVNSNLVFSQCPISPIPLESQQDIINFAAAYPNCTKLLGTWTILTKDDNDPIVDLSILPPIDTVLGDLYISWNSELENLKGLDSLRFVSNFFEVNYNERLNSLEGLGSLKQIGRSNADKFTTGFSIIGCSSLPNFNGINRLNRAYGYCYFSENSLIEDFTGLENVIEFPDGLYIQNNNRLKNLKGLLNLTTADFIDIFNNDSLVSLQGMPTLGPLKLMILEDNDMLSKIECDDSILPDRYFIWSIAILGNKSLIDLSGLSKCLPESMGSLQIYNNPLIDNLDFLNHINSLHYLTISNSDGLKSLIGLENLKSIRFDFLLSSNHQLESLNGLNDSLSIQRKLSIKYNPNLSSCSIEPICHHIRKGRPFDIESNEAGCSANDVLEDCDIRSNTHTLELNRTRIYPNPATDWIQIDLSSDLAAGSTIKIYNSLGQLKYQSDLPISPIDVSSWARGLYWVSIGNQTLPIAIVPAF